MLTTSDDAPEKLLKTQFTERKILLKTIEAEKINTKGKIL